MARLRIRSAADVGALVAITIGVVMIASTLFDARQWWVGVLFILSLGAAVLMNRRSRR